MADDDLGENMLAQIAGDRNEAALDWLRAGRRAQPVRPEMPTTPAPIAAAEEGGASVNESGLLERLAGVYSGTKAVAKDIGGGLIGIGRSIPAGIYDAAYHSVGALNDLGNALNSAVPAEVPVEGIPEWLANPIGALHKAMPAPLPKETTTTGSVIRTGAQFLTGFGPALKAAGAVLPAWLAPSVAGGIAQGVVMDPNQPGLSNLIQSVPALQNPVAEYLATDPNDSAALNRLRQAVEGTGMGMLTDAVTHGIRAVALSSRGAGAAGNATIQSAEQNQRLMQSALVSPPDMPLTLAGRKLNKAMADLGVPTDVVAKGVAGSAEETANRAGVMRTLGVPVMDDGGGATVYVNFARINTPDDVQQVIRDVADAFKGSIVKAQRGTISNEQTSKLAAELGLSVEEVLKRPTGAAYNAETALASRRLLNTSATNLLEMAKAAALAPTDEAAQVGFRRMLAVHAAMQAEVLGARTETARALQSWAIPAGTEGAETLTRNLTDLLERMGGAQTSAQMARAIAGLEGLPPGAISTAVRRGYGAITWDMVRESYILGLLWRPSTHIVNTVSNLAVAAQQVVERSFANKMGKALGTSMDDAVVDGEALALLYGQLSSIKNGFRVAFHALKTGEKQLGGTKIEAPVGAISANAVIRDRAMNAAEAEAFRDSFMGRALDMVGAVVRGPGRVLDASDDFFKTIGYSGEVAAQSLRQASKEGLEGPAMWRRMMEIANDPPESIKLAGVDAAKYLTFQNNAGRIAMGLNAIRSGTFNPMVMLLPFVRTPMNLLSYSFERSPFAPMVAHWRADFLAGGARRDLAMSRAALGTAVWMAQLDYAMSGYVTGKGPDNMGRKETLLRSGWQPNSLVIGDKFVKYDRADPFAMSLATAAAIAEMAKEKEISPAEFDQVSEWLAGGALAIGAAVTNKTWFTSVANLIQAFEDHSRHGGVGAFERMWNRQMASLVPGTTALRTIREAVDPVMRDQTNFWSYIQNQIAGMSSQLPAARNLWGEEISPKAVYGRAYDLLSPYRVSEWKPDPIDAEMAALNMGADRIRKTSSFNGVPMDFKKFPKVYEEYVKLAGNEFKHPAFGMGAKDYLNSVVEGKNAAASPLYASLTDGQEGGKAQFIKKIIQDYRAMAAMDILARAPKEFPEFLAEFEKVRRERVLRTAPVNIPGGPPVPPTPQLPRPPQGSGGGIQVPGVGQ